MNASQKEIGKKGSYTKFVTLQFLATKYKAREREREWKRGTIGKKTTRKRERKKESGDKRREKERMRVNVCECACTVMNIE